MNGIFTHGMLKPYVIQVLPKEYKLILQITLPLSVHVIMCILGVTEKSFFFN